MPTFTGFGDVDSIGGNLRIKNNAGLVALNGMDSLKYVGGLFLGFE